MTFVGEQDADAGIEEGEFAQPVLERREVELDHREGFGAGLEGDFRPGFAAAVAKRHQRCVGDAVGEADLVDLALALDAQLEPDRQRVDDGDADAMQTAGHLVGVLVEFAAGVQLGHDHFGSGYALAGVDIRRDTTTIVGHRHRAVGVERYGYQVGVTTERFVDGVVDNFVDHVMQAGAVIRVADIHAGPLAHGIEALQDLDGVSAIFRIGGIFGRGNIGHGLKSFVLSQVATILANHRFSSPNYRVFHSQCQIHGPENTYKAGD